LNFESKKLTNRFEEKKFEVQTLCGFVDFVTDRPRTYSTKDDARVVAEDYRKKFFEMEQRLLAQKKIAKTVKEFDRLKNYVRIIEEFNVFVFEFVENWNKKEKTNFNGFFMTPNFIILKRQKYYRREIFTLLHEFAHFLLNIEEIDELNESKLAGEQSTIERWCNEFAYYFLAGEHDQTLHSLPVGTPKNNFHEEIVQTIHANTFLGYSAVYTRLYLNNKLSRKDYDSILHRINESVVQEEFKRKLQLAEEKALLKEQGKQIKGGLQKPIPSRLLKEVAKLNYFRGNLDDSQLCSLLNIKPGKIEMEIYS
jgi:Zn-dependent peptidase ImmA (M78 family)